MLEFVSLFTLLEFDHYNRHRTRKGDVITPYLEQIRNRLGSGIIRRDGRYPESSTKVHWCLTDQMPTGNLF
jgi:hypothetical protein